MPGDTRNVCRNTHAERQQSVCAQFSNGLSLVKRQKMAFLVPLATYVGIQATSNSLVIVAQ